MDAFGVILERRKTAGRVEVAAGIAQQRIRSKSRVRVSGVRRQRAIPEGTVSRAAVAEKGKCSKGAILICVVAKERPRSEPCVEAARRVASQRKETTCGVVAARGKAEENILPFRRVACGIAAIRRRNDRSRSWRKWEAGKQKRDEN